MRYDPKAANARIQSRLKEIRRLMAALSKAAKAGKIVDAKHTAIGLRVWAEATESVVEQEFANWRDDNK